MSTRWNHFNLSCGNRISVNIGRKRGEVVIGMRESEKRKKTRNDMKKMGMKTAKGKQKRKWKAHVKGQISSAEREYEGQNASEHRAKKVNNKGNADVNGAEKAEEKSWVLFGFSPALRPRKGRKLLNQSPFDTGSTLSYLFLLDEGK